ncbi:DUF2953 domain-containing protein [Lacrimispora celerecrescens]|uniref:DUF2953 family protein n=1 Tax=[Clostridium] celerecrescens 18A TaxID=1286362 RepID=A0A2M8Z447_9FIRM|nr:DUF2953 domain-containing protein [Lacrimispora celerecrescens]PJJ28215.1 Protein of unknown function (DUF2953) [[Clostridium] celerecrescens 18A]
MLHIILFILKILGLLVLIVLGLVLTVALLILLVPVRYQAEGSYDGKVKGKARITWLLHILSVTAQYEEDLIVRIRIFGFRKGKPKKMDSELKEAEDIMVQAMEIMEPEPIREAQEVKDEIHDRVKEIPKNLPPPREELRNLTPPKEESKKKKGFRVMGVFEKLKKKVLMAFTKLKFFFLRICDTLRTIKDKKDEIYAWVSNKENQKTGKLLFRQVKRLIRHILPRRGKGNITFGFDDPYLTGQVLTYASVIYPLCHKHLNLYPVFDQTVFMVEGTFRGRIRLGTALFIGLRMLLDRNFRRLLKGWLHKGGIA